MKKRTKKSHKSKIVTSPRDHAIEAEIKTREEKITSRKKSDLNRFRALLNEWGVPFSESFTSDEGVDVEIGLSSLASGRATAEHPEAHDRLIGYDDFRALFRFSEGERFIAAGAWE